MLWGVFNSSILKSKSCLTLTFRLPKELLSIKTWDQYFLPWVVNILYEYGKQAKESTGWKRHFEPSRSKVQIQIVGAHLVFFQHSGLCMLQYLPDPSSKCFFTVIKCFICSTICFTVLVLSSKRFFYFWLLFCSFFFSVYILISNRYACLTWRKKAWWWPQRCFRVVRLCVSYAKQKCQIHM